MTPVRPAQAHSALPTRMASARPPSRSVPALARRRHPRAGAEAAARRPKILRCPWEALHYAAREEPLGTEKTAGGNGNGGRLEARLREVETRLTRIETKLDTELNHLATKAWVLGGVVAGMIGAATIAAAVVRWL